ncbi:hypothetical protein ACWOUW_004251 [Vibrio vulnificus]
MKLTSEEKRTLALTILTLIVGYLIAIFLNDPLVFSRFGSIVVCLGIYWGMKDYPGLLDKFKDFSDSIKHKHIGEISKELEKSGVSNDEVEQFNKDAMTRFDKQVNQQFSEMKERFFKFEASILCLGTIIWGFGDLLVFVADKT